MLLGIGVNKCLASLILQFSNQGFAVQLQPLKIFQIFFFVAKDSNQACVLLISIKCNFMLEKNKNQEILFMKNKMKLFQLDFLKGYDFS